MAHKLEKGGLLFGELLAHLLERGWLISFKCGGSLFGDAVGH